MRACLNAELFHDDCPLSSNFFLFLLLEGGSDILFYESAYYITIMLLYIQMKLNLIEFLFSFVFQENLSQKTKGTQGVDEETPYLLL